MAMSYSPTTITLRDALKYETDLLDNLEMSTDTRTQNFINMFKSIYNSKSIGAETISLFRYWIEDKFNEVKDYYEKKLDIYEMELNGNDGNKITRSLTENNGSTVSNTTNTDITDTVTNYDLPRSSNATAIPTTQATDVQDKDATSTSTGTGNRSLSETITGDVNVIEQREKWLNYIRNIYKDMCNEFKDCFAIIYS